VSPLVSLFGLPADAEIDVVNNDNVQTYWQRSDRFDMALDLSGGHDGVAALAKAMELWIAHLLGLAVTIEALTELRDAPVIWYVGLDADATQIGDALWNGEKLDDDRTADVVSLFRLTFHDSHLVLDKVKGEPVYLMLAMTRHRLIRMKPQNLVTGLPIKHLELVS
jgi:hypothetical protein